MEFLPLVPATVISLMFIGFWRKERVKNDVLTQQLKEARMDIENLKDANPRYAAHFIKPMSEMTDPAERAQREREIREHMASYNR